MRPNILNRRLDYQVLTKAQKIITLLQIAF
jgi:hypothetical protein